MFGWRPSRRYWLNGKAVKMAVLCQRSGLPEFLPAQKRFTAGQLKFSIRLTTPTLTDLPKATTINYSAKKSIIWPPRLPPLQKQNLTLLRAPEITGRVAFHPTGYFRHCFLIYPNYWHYWHRVSVSRSLSPLGRYGTLRGLMAWKKYKKTTFSSEHIMCQFFWGRANNHKGSLLSSPKSPSGWAHI